MIAAIDWPVDNRQQICDSRAEPVAGHGADAGNQDDPLCQAVERAARAGLVVVASAGLRANGLTDGRFWAA